MSNISESMKHAVKLAESSNVKVMNFSPCLPSWIETFKKAYEKDEAVVLTPNSSAALYYVLLCAKIREVQLNV